MKNKYDIYSTGNAEPVTPRRSDTDPVSGLPVVLFVIGVVILLLFALFFLFRNGATAVHTRLDPYREYSDLLKAGEELAARGEHEQAVARFTEGIAKFSRSLDPFYLERGKSYEALGDFSSALDDYDRACHNPMGVESLERRTLLCLKLAEKAIADNDHSAAADFFRQALNSDEMIVLEWRLPFHVRRRIAVYEIHATPADLYWVRLNNGYLSHSEQFHSLDGVDCKLSHAERFYGQGDYVQAVDCLDHVMKCPEFMQLNEGTRMEIKTLHRLISGEIHAP